MRDEPIGKSLKSENPHDRFTELGKKVLAVPKDEIDKRENRWQKRKRIKPGPKKRG
jgi:hypothetical protein